MKYIKILFINFFIIFCIYQLLEVIFFGIDLFRSYPYCNKDRTIKQYIIDNFRDCYLQKYIKFETNYKKLPFRPISGKQYINKKPILIFGCSYAYGFYLDDTETISYKLSEYTKRKVYNRSFPGWGPQDMLYQLKRKDFYNIVQEEPEYIVYIFINGHSYRIFREVWTFEVQTFYRKTKDRLKESIFKSGGFLYGYIARTIRYQIGQYLTTNPKNLKFTEDMLLSHFTESKKEAQKHWKNTKYIILVYDYNNYEKNIIEKLKDEGFEIIFAEDLTDINLKMPEYQLSEHDTHPNEKAWNLLVPLLSKRLKLN